MRRIVAFFSIGVFLISIHRSIGAPRNIPFLASDELQELMKKYSNDINKDLPIESHDDNYKDEESVKKIIDISESNNKSSEEINIQQDNDDVILPPLIDIYQRKISSDDDE